MKQLLYSNDTFVVKGDSCFYFRICRWGLWFAKYAKWPMSFSEREGYIKALKIAPGWRVHVLRPLEGTSKATHSENVEQKTAIGGEK